MKAYAKTIPAEVGRGHKASRFSGWHDDRVTRRYQRHAARMQDKRETYADVDQTDD